MKTNKKNLVVIAFLAITLGMKAQDHNNCEGFGGFFVSSWEKFYKIGHPIGEKALTLIPIVGKEEEIVDAISEVSEDFHNEIFNENRQSWTTLGAREIPILNELTTQGGTLQRVGPVAGVRVFTSAPLWWDWVEIEIEKQKGGLETEIVICTFNVDSGAKNIVENYVFPNNKDLSSKKFKIRNTHGKSVSVKLLGKESNLDRFKYRIKTKGFLNMNKQRKRAGAYGKINLNKVGTKKRN